MFLVAENSNFTLSNISRNLLGQLELNVRYEAELGTYKAESGITSENWLLTILDGTHPKSEKIYGDVATKEIQFGRGITDEIKTTDTHIRLIAKSSVAGVVVRVFFQNLDDDLELTHRWFRDVELSNTLTTYDFSLSEFREYQYPFNPLNQVGTGLSLGQQLRVAGIMFYETTDFILTIDTLRPVPQIALPYTPAIATYTANTKNDKLLDWQGGPGIGYQNAWIWSKLADATKRATMVGFIKDSQDEFNSRYGGQIGPFVPAYIWDRYDTRQVAAGTPNTWTWDWVDPNSEWVGYTARCTEGLARCANEAADTTARTIAENFLTWLDTYWDGIKFIPGNFPESVPPRLDSTAYALDSRMDGYNGFFYRADVAGTTASSNPGLTTIIGNTTIDGTVTWRCAGYMYGSHPIFGEYHEPHAASLFLRAACYYRLAGGNTTLADSIITKCWTYLESLVVTSGVMAGTWSNNPAGEEWYGFWGAEITETLAQLLSDFDSIRIANGISDTTIQTRLANYLTWVTDNTRTVDIHLMDDVVDVDDVQVETTQDIELPNQVSVKYRNMENSGDYETRYYRKHSGKSNANVNVNVNHALTGQFASDLAKKLANSIWSERNKYSFAVNDYLMQPTDSRDYVIEGKVKRMYIKSTTLNEQGKLDVLAVSYDPSVYVPNSISAAESLTNNVILSYPPLTNVIILNLPAIVATDNSPGYASGATAGVNWRGGSMDVSNDNGLTFATEAVYGVQLTYGTVDIALPSNSTNVIDQSTELEITLGYGIIEGITEDQLFRGQNLALLGTELICFQTVTQVTAAIFKISNFLRGCYGTEDQIYSHIPGEQFILLNGAVTRSPLTVANIGVTRVARSYTAGRPPVDYTEFNITPTAANLIPWAPVKISSNRATDLTISWVRRARINWQWLDSNDVPLGEDSEQYVVQLLTNPLYLSGTVIVEYTVTSPTITITNAQIASAYGSGSATVHVAIRQINSIVGAGKQLEGSF